MLSDPQFLEAIDGLSTSLKTKLALIPAHMTYHIHEIRLRHNSPIAISTGSRVMFLGTDGVLHNKPNTHCAITTQSEMEASYVSLCGYAVHTHQEEINQGFISLKGGHRVGLAATAVYDDKGNIKNVRAVSSYVIRVSRGFVGVSLPIVYSLLSHSLEGVLIAGVPGSGKTTILCDLAMQLSSGEVITPRAVAVIDERGEIAPRLAGVSGINCELLCGYRKDEGIITAVRALAPSLLLCDELGGKKDVEAILWALNCGVPIITTIHGKSLEELLRRPTAHQLIASGAFRHLVLLAGPDNPCKVKEVVRLDEYVDTVKVNGCALHPV